jgi:hypothetical protein
VHKGSTAASVIAECLGDGDHTNLFLERSGRVLPSNSRLFAEVLRRNNRWLSLWCTQNYETLLQCYY